MTRIRLPLLPREFKVELAAESGQCVIRIVGGLLCAVLFIVVGRGRPNVQPVPTAVAGLVAALYGVVWAWVCHFRLGTLNRRVLTALTLDQCIIAVVMHYGGELALLCAWAMPFANIGSGLRFGPHYSTIGALVGTVAEGVAFGASPYWRSVPFVSIGIILLNPILSVYLTKLAAKVWAEKHESEQRAARLEIAARTDYLTSILNRAGFEAELGRALAAGPNRQPVTVMLLDLDGFKAINDAAGHAAGDEVLRCVARGVRATIRKEDVFARIGGDEFGLIARGVTDPSRVSELVDALHAVFADITVPEHPALRIGVSIGYKIIAEGNWMSAEAALDWADRMMYESKRGVRA